MAQAEVGGDSDQERRQSDQEGHPAIDPRGAADALFASSTLVDLLILFCREPDRAYYVNELIKLTGRFPRSIQLGLAKLESSGLVRSERRANARFFQIVPDHPFFPELRAIASRIVDLRGELARDLRALDGIEAAFLRPPEPDSPERELVVVGEIPPREVDLAVEEVARRLDRAIRVQVIGVEDWRRQARRERSFVRWLLEEAREYVVGSDATLP